MGLPVLHVPLSIKYLKYLKISNLPAAPPFLSLSLSTYPLRALPLSLSLSSLPACLSVYSPHPPLDQLRPTHLPILN